MTQQKSITITHAGRVLESTKGTSGNIPSDTASGTASGTNVNESGPASGNASKTRRKAPKKEEKTPARSGQLWSAQENEALLQLLAEGMSHGQAGAVLGRSAQACRLALLHIREAQDRANGIMKPTGVKKTSGVTKRAPAKKPTHGKKPANGKKTSGGKGASAKPAGLLSPRKSPPEKTIATGGGSVPSAPQLPPTSNIGGWRPATAEAASRLLDVMEGSSSNAAGASSSASVGLPTPFSEGAHNLMVLATAAQHHGDRYASEAPPPADQSLWSENDWRSRRMLARMVDCELVKLRAGREPTEESLAVEGGLFMSVMNDLHRGRTVPRATSRWNPRGSSAGS